MLIVEISGTHTEEGGLRKLTLTGHIEGKRNKEAAGRLTCVNGWLNGDWKAW